MLCAKTSNPDLATFSTQSASPRKSGTVTTIVQKSSKEEISVST